MAARDDDTQVAARTLEEICQNYWYPLYAYARRQGLGPEDAEDGTQEFFQNLLKKESLRTVNPEIGKLRCFLLASMRNHLANVSRRRTAEKRGGSTPLLSIDAPFAEACLSKDLPHQSLPDEAFDRCWAQSILESALKKLKLWYHSKARGSLFEALHPFLVGSDRQDATGKYHAVAVALGVNETSLRTALFQMRKRYRTMIENEIRETVASPAAAEEELEHFRDILKLG